MPDNESRYITTQEAAAYLQLAKNTLEKYRSIGNKGPKFYRINGSRVRYKFSDLDEYMESACYTATSDYLN